MYITYFYRINKYWEIKRLGLNTVVVKTQLNFTTLRLLCQGYS